MEVILIVVMVAMVGLMIWQSRNARKQESELRDFRESLEPGTEVITIGGIIGKVVSVDTQYEEIVIDSEGSLLRFAFRAVNKAYTRPAYVSDDEVDEDGNPLTDDSDAPQESIDDDNVADQVAIEAASEDAEEGTVEEEAKSPSEQF